MSSSLSMKVLLTILAVFSVSLLGAQHPSSPQWTVGLESALKDLPTMRIPIDSLVGKLTGETTRIQDVRLFPLIRHEQGNRVPIEFTIIMTESDIIPVLQTFGSIQKEEGSIMIQSMFIATSAEVTAKKKPLLAAVIHSWIIDRNSLSEDGRQANNQKFVRAFEDLLNTTTFTPQVSRKLLFSGAQGTPPQAISQILPGSSGHWLTSFRIDQDWRVLFSGYSVGDMKNATALWETFSTVGSFYELSPLTQNDSVYEKIPASRFEFSARIKNE